jgi:hypothetical protein
MLVMKNEEERYSSLNVQDGELDKSITEEEFNFNEVMNIFSSSFYDCYLR